MNLFFLIKKFLSKQIVVRIYLLLGGNVAAAAISLLQNIILAKSIGPELLGAWAMVQSAVTLATSFLGFRTEEACGRHLVEYRQDAGRRRLQYLISGVVAAEFGSRIVAVIGLVILSRIMGGGQFRADAIIALSIYSLSCLAQGLDSLWLPLWRNLGKYREISLWNTASALSRLIAVIVLVLCDQLNLVAFAIVFSGLAWIEFFIRLGFVKKDLRDNYRIDSLLVPLKNILRGRRIIRSFWEMMFYNFAASSLSSVVKNADVLIIGTLLSERDAGLYQVARRLSSMGYMLTQAIVGAIINDFSEMVVAQHFKKLWQKVVRYTLILIPIISICFIIIAVISPWVISLMFGDDFREAWKPFVILTAGMGFSIILFWVQPLMVGFRLQRHQLIANFMINIAYFAMIYGTIGYLGSLSVALSYALCLTAGYGVMAFYMWRHWPQSPVGAIDQ